MTPPDWEGDREMAKQRFLRSVALAVEAILAAGGSPGEPAVHP
jgi:hypothetical protein